MLQGIQKKYQAQPRTLNTSSIRKSGGPHTFVSFHDQKRGGSPTSSSFVANRIDLYVPHEMPLEDQLIEVFFKGFVPLS